MRDSEHFAVVRSLDFERHGVILVLVRVKFSVLARGLDLVFGRCGLGQEYAEI
jgi:hypothetical protein